MTKRFALKIPRLRPWIACLEGFRANLEERAVWRQFRGDPRLCPVIFADCIGLIVVMPFARPLIDEEFDRLGTDDLATVGSPFDRSFSGDFKRANFGMLNGRAVKIDYGGCWWPT